MNEEVAFISSVCTKKDPKLLFADVRELFRSHGEVWDWVKQYYSIYKSMPTLELLAEEFKFFTPVKTPGETEHYLDKLREEWLRQQLNELALTLSQDTAGGAASTHTLSKAMRRVSELHKTTSPVRDVDIVDSESAHKEYALRKAAAEANGGSIGIKFGIDKLDAGYPTGMAPGHFIVLIGWSGHGKTWFSILMAAQAFKQYKRPMFVSLEMSPETLRDRVYTVLGEGQFKNTELVRGDVDLDVFDKWADSNLDGERAFKIVATDSAQSVVPQTVQAKAEEHQPDIIFLDYAQLFDDNDRSANMTTKMFNVSRQFKLMSVQLGIPIVLLTQATMSDKSDVNSPPMIEQVAWSKSIQNDADLALAVHKYTDEDRFEIVARKNRHGPDFAVVLDWKLNEGRYVDWSERAAGMDDEATGEESDDKFW